MWGFSPPSLSSGCMPPPPFSQWEPVSRLQPSENKVFWGQFDRVHYWTQLRALYKLLRFWWAWAEIYLSFSLQDKTLMEIPCMLNLPPTNLDWPSYTGASFRFHLGVSWGFQPSSQLSKFIGTTSDLESLNSDNPKYLGVSVPLSSSVISIIMHLIIPFILMLWGFSEIVYVKGLCELQM